jgi:hypothetical protein
MDEINYSFKPTGQLSVFNFKPNYNISFHNNGQEIGKLDFNGHALVFTGDAEESAKVFIDWIARSFYGRLEEERKAEREACAKEFDRRAVYVDGSPSSGWYEPDEPARIIRARGNT